MDREKIGFYVDVVMIVLALITVFLLFYEMTIIPVDIPGVLTPETIPEDVKEVLPTILAIHRLDFLICIVFITEFVVRIWKEEDRRGYLRAHWLEIPGMIPFTIVRVSRVFRIFRLFRLVRVFSLMKRFSRLYEKRFVRNELQYAAIIIITILLFSSYGIFFFERKVNPDIDSVGDAVWWSVVTVTTVGYGDKVPITPLGKVIGIILMFTGIGIIGILSGTIASHLLKGYKTEKKEDVIEALRILKLRRAKGEVTEEQYKEIRTDLEEMLKGT
jgi:voltage-gated potassium channel